MSDNNNTPNGFDVFSMFCGIIVIGVIAIKLLMINAVMGIVFGLGSWYFFKSLKDRVKGTEKLTLLISALVLGGLAILFFSSYF
jgi:ABC-type bacteriocin/lantibiotic exporter with double-glycine peptidase domain